MFVGWLTSPEPSGRTSVVVVNPPPPDPDRRVSPRFCAVPSGASLVRLFDPTSQYRQTALSFRFHGPLRRFDHHRRNIATGAPTDDPARGIWYGGWSTDGSNGLTSCLVEIFGDTGIVEFAHWHVATPVVRRTLRLLDLRGKAAMNAGTVAAIAACDHTLAQPWSRYFYETPAMYPEIDGVLYPNAHNHAVALALYERAGDDLICPPDRIIPLNHPDLRPTILRIMLDNSLIAG